MDEWFALADSDGYFINRQGEIKGKHKNGTKILKQMTNRKGYLFVEMRVNGERKHGTIHRLLAQTFIPNPDEKPQVDHINRNPQDNRLENLRWVTGSENCENKEAKHIFWKTIHKRWIVKIKRNGVRYEKGFKELPEAEKYLQELLLALSTD